MKKSKVIISALLAILMVASLIFTGCSNPDTITPSTPPETPDNPEPETPPTEKKYPETLSDEEKALIGESVGAADFDYLLSKIAQIISILKRQYGDDASKESASLSAIYNSIYDKLNLDTYEKKDMLSFNDPYFVVKKENDDYKNYDDYESLYDIWEDAFSDFEVSKQEYEESYNNYNVYMYAYNDLLEYVKDAVKDFQDNFKLDEIYTITNEMVDNVNAENESRKAFVDNYCAAELTVLADYEKLKDAYKDISTFNFEKNDGSLVPGIDPNDPSNPPQMGTITYKLVYLDDGYGHLYSTIVDEKGDEIRFNTDAFYDKNTGKLTKNVKLVLSDTVDVDRFYKLYTEISKYVTEDFIEYENGLGGTTFKEGPNIDQWATFKDLVLGDVEAKKDDPNVKGDTLPTLDFSLWADDNTKFNLYGRGVDKVLDLYNAKNVRNRAKISLPGSYMYFDAKEYLESKGGYMYNTDDTFNDAYEVDINTALLMNVHLKNVKVTGIPVFKNVEIDGTKKAVLNGVTNVYFTDSLAGLDEITTGAGIIEFANRPPKQTPMASKAKVVLRYLSKSNGGLIIGNVHALDLSKLKETYDESKIYKPGEVGVQEVYYGTITTGTVGRTVDPIEYINGTQTGGAGKTSTSSSNYRAWEVTGNDKFHALPTGPVL